MELRKKILQHAGPLYAVCYTSKLDLIFTGGADNIVASWDPITFENTDFSIKTSSTILNLTIVNETQLFIGLFNGDVHVIDLETKKEIKYITYHKKGVYASLYNRKTNYLIIGSGDGNLSIWDCKNYDLLLSKKISDSKIRAITMVDNLVYVGTTEGVLYVLDVVDMSLVDSYNISEEGINSLSLIPQKNAILLGGKDAHLTMYSTSLNKVVLKIPAHNWAIYKVLVIENILITCSRDKTIKEWDLTTMNLIKRHGFPQVKSHTHSVNSMEYIAKHQLIVSVGDDKAICIWSL
ncbi:MAG: WD repeat-containing protein 61 [Saprospiraceae bacterium]